MTVAVTLWNALAGIILLAVAAIVLWAHITRTKRADWKDTAEDWKASFEASEARLRVLEAQDERRQRELFDLGVQVMDVERTNKRIGRQNLALQKQVDNLLRREKQLITLLRAHGITVPEPDDEEDE